MKKYARIYNGAVFEFFETDGDITQMFHPDFIWVDVTNTVPAPEEGWDAAETDGIWSFAPHVAPPPTPAEILASQSDKLQRATQLAAAQKTALANRINTLNDAIELEMATPAEEAELPVRTLQLKAWKTYAVLLGRVTSQPGWPPQVNWPVQPADGMDLTVSSVAPTSPQAS